MKDNLKNIPEKTPLQEHLEHLFEQMLPEDNAPEEMKSRVFDTIDTLVLVGDLVSLFTVEFGQSEFELMDLVGKGKQSDKE
jgi:hypothetical protein